LNIFFSFHGTLHIYYWCSQELGGAQDQRTGIGGNDSVAQEWF